MVEWHREDLSAEDIQDIIREGRDKEDNTIFDNYGDYVNYISKDNDRILEEHDHSQCEPNETTKLTFEEVLEELRKEREERLDWLIEDMFQRNKKTLDAIGSDYDENGIPYWEKWDYNNDK